MVRCHTKLKNLDTSPRSEIMIRVFLTLVPAILLLLPSAQVLAESQGYPESEKQIVGVAHSISEDQERVWVLGPLIDVHAGPGKGYSIIHTLEKGEQLQLHKQFTNWVKITAQNGLEGWIYKQDLSKLADAHGRPLTSRVANISKAGKYSIHAGTGLVDSAGHVYFGAGYGLSDKLRVNFSATQIFESYLQGFQFHGALQFDLKPFAFLSDEPLWQPYVSLGYGVLTTDRAINRQKSFDTFKSSLGLGYQLFNNIEVTMEYGKDLVLISGPTNIHGDSIRFGLLSYF